jgi:hypothetical protein
MKANARTACATYKAILCNRCGEGFEWRPKITVAWVQVRFAAECARGHIG